ncbi:unnamed protein product, partial [marine sediment metagenome]
KNGKMDLKKIKKVAKSDKYLYVFFEIPSKECLIIPHKYGSKWWKKATKKDILRVSPCERKR